MELGVSPRRLNGWTPAEYTHYVYDDSGRLLSSVTVKEPEFDDRDIAVMVAARRAKLAPRGPHGHLLSEATSKDADPASWNAKFRYVVPVPERDHAQHAINEAKEAYRKQYKDADLSDLLFAVERIPVAYQREG